MSHPPASQAARWLQGQGNGVVAEKKRKRACGEVALFQADGETSAYITLDLPACILTRIEFSG